MKNILAVLALVFGCSGAVHAQGVVASPDHRAELVGLVQGTEVSGELATVPVDDGGKWQLLLFTSSNCPPCEQLKKALSSSPNLRAIASEDGSGWAHLLIYDQGQESQKFRFADYEITTTPTVVITTSPTARQFPYTQVFRREGFDGDPDKLARSMVSAITLFAAKHPPKVSDAVADCPCPKPAPAPERTPILPNLVPNLVPHLPNFPPDSVTDWALGKLIDSAINKIKANLLLILMVCVVVYWLWTRRPQQQPIVIQQPQPQLPQVQPMPQPVVIPQPQPQAIQQPQQDTQQQQVGVWGNDRPSHRAWSTVSQAQVTQQQYQYAAQVAAHELEAAAAALQKELEELQAARKAMPQQPQPNPEETK